MTRKRPLSDHNPHRRTIILRALGGVVLGMGRPGRGQAQTSADVLDFCYPDNMPPFSFPDKQGHPAGLGIDLMDCILAPLGWRQNPRLLPWARAQAMLRDGQCDGTITLATRERQQYMIFSNQPLVPAIPGVWHRTDDQRTVGARGLADLRGLRQGNYLGNGLAREILGAESVSWAPNPETALRMLQAGHIDVLLHAGTFFDLVVRHLGLTHQLAFTPLPDLPCPLFTIGIRRNLSGSAALIEQINGAIIANRATIDTLIARYPSEPS